MPHKILAIVLIVLLSSCGSSQLDGKWISTSDSMNAGDYVYLEFSSNKLLLVSTENNVHDLVSYQYVLSPENELILNDTINLGIVENLSDSLLVIGEDSFMPLADYGLSSETDKLIGTLTGGAWYFDDYDGRKRLEFYSDYYFEDVQKFRVALKYDERPGWENSKLITWQEATLGKSLIFGMSYNQLIYFRFYQVKEISDSLIILESAYTGSLFEISLVAIPKLSDHDYANTKSILEGTWQQIAYHEPIDSFVDVVEEIPLTTQDGKRSRPFHPDDSVPFLFDTYFEENALIYIFDQAGKCALVKDADTLRTGFWDLSADGGYIKTRNSFLSSMHILEFSDTLLTIGRHETIEFADSNAWKNDYIVEKLKKVE